MTATGEELMTVDTQELVEAANRCRDRPCLLGSELDFGRSALPGR
jgi:hypothetical protein